MAQTCDYLGLKLDIPFIIKKNKKMILEMAVCADGQKYNSKEDRLVVL